MVYLGFRQWHTVIHSYITEHLPGARAVLGVEDPAVDKTD